MVSIPTKNTYIDLEVQEFTTSGGGMEEHTEHIHDQRPQNSAMLNRQVPRHVYTEGSNVNREQRNKHQTLEVQINMNKQIGYQQDAVNRSGIDSMLPLPAILYTDNASVGVAVGDPIDHQRDDNFDEYRAPDSEDEYDMDTQSLGEGIEPGEEINTFDQHQKGPLIHSSNVDEIIDVTGKQGLSPRGRKLMKQNKNASTSTPNTRARSRGSDHCPLLMEMNENKENAIKYFKFLNCWTENESFLHIVENCWKKKVAGNPMWIFHTKMRRLTKTLRDWSKKEYGDVFEKVKQYEEGVKIAEGNFIMDNSKDNREKLYAANAHYRDENIARETCDYYQGIFTGKTEKIREDLLQCIPKLITQEHNVELEKMPSEEEVRRVVMNMNPNSAPGPDGIGGKFYQVCFDIIKDDLLAAVQSFFNGYDMPKYMTHACLILLPKVDHPNKLKDFRPISLSNFTNKIISKIMSTRLTPILPTIVSDNQSDFVKGMSISENIMLAQEVIHGIKLPKEGKNVVIKLDMVKAYDRELVSDQKVNKDKSFFMVTDKTKQDIIDIIKIETGFGMKNSSITYLGCPLYIGGQRIIYYSEVVEKIIKKISGWQTKSFVDFFWGIDKDGKKYHWASWETLAYPTSESGIGVRLLDDVCIAFQYKQWWEFRTKNSLWSKFLKAKYCQRANLVAKKYDSGDSLVWRYLTRNRQAVKSHIKWKIHSGTCSFWWDNWFGNGAIANHCDSIFSLNNSLVSDFLNNGIWKERFVRQNVPPLVVPDILQTNFIYNIDIDDTAVWTPEENGKFTIASAWEVIRKKRLKDLINIVWHKHIPFKIAFFIWSALRGKLPTNENLQKFGRAEAECYCCYRKGKNDIKHILLTGNFTIYIIS
nr:uncharacterized protein LOC109119692 [Solanum lycopersicum]